MPARSRSERRADQRVRRLVSRYGACLPQLPARQRKVLLLRAGVGPRDPATREGVARRLDLPAARVRKAERRGLRLLRRAARAGCPAVGDGTGVDPDLSTAPGADLGAAAPGTAVLASGSGGGDPDDAPDGLGDDDSSSGAARGGTDSDGDAAGGVKGITATNTAPDLGETGVVVPLIGVLLVLACVAGFALETRRMWRSGTRSGVDC